MNEKKSKCNLAWLVFRCIDADFSDLYLILQGFRAQLTSFCRSQNSFLKSKCILPPKFSVTPGKRASRRPQKVASLKAPVW